MYRFTTGFGYLVNKVGARIGDLFSRDLAPYGVTVLMYRVLAGLWEKGDQQLGELSVMTTIELSTLSRLVSALKRKGLVSRVRVQTDERSIRINLSAKGRALATEVMAVAARQEAVYVRTLGEDEMTVLKRSLATVFDNLDQLERENANAASKPILRRRTSGRRAPRRGAREARSS
jgi:DNA-binding MarR family transcriptional regulator